MTIITMAQIDEKLDASSGLSMERILGSIETWFSDEDKFLDESCVLNAIKMFRADGTEDPVLLGVRLDMLRRQIIRWVEYDRMSARDILLYVQRHGTEKYMQFVEKIHYANQANFWLSEIRNVIMGLQGKTA